MLLLPQILYIFRTLSILLGPTYFRSLNFLLKHYVWSSKRTIGSKALLTKHRSAGSMGFTYLWDYYRASLLTQLKVWYTNISDAPWCNIEQTLSPTKDLFSLLLLDNRLPYLPLTIQASLMAWRDLCSSTHSPDKATEVPIPIDILTKAIPNITITDWHNKGITHIADLFHNDHLKTFHSLQMEYNLLPKDEYKYYQISHFLRSL